MPLDSFDQTDFGLTTRTEVCLGHFIEKTLLFASSELEFAVG